MRSLKIGKILGIPIELHSTFVLGALLIFLGMLLFAFAGAFPIGGIFPALLFIFLLFLSVFFHELMHSIVLMEKGFRVEKIILLPIGGISVSETLPENPAEEFQVSVAGPLFNFFVAGTILLLSSTFGIPLGLEKLLEENFFAILESPLLSLFYVNLVLGTFNLFFPALPLDGGRVARSLLAYFVGWKTATMAVSRISMVLAIFLFILGFVSGNILIAVIALFIFFGSQQESQTVEMKETLRGADILPLLEKAPMVVQGETTLQDVFELMTQKRQLAFLVELPQGFGLVSYETLEGIPREQWESVRAGDVAQKLPSISLKANAAELMSKVLTKGYPLFPVVQQGKLIGVILSRGLQKLYEIEKLKKKES